MPSTATRRAVDREPPTLAELIGAAIAYQTEFDGGNRDRLARAIYASTRQPSTDNGGINVPPMIARSILPETVARTGVGYVASGAGYGASVKPEWAGFIADRARPTYGVCDLMTWMSVPTREFRLAAVQETSRATGSRWGGITATWGLGETSLPTQSDGALSQAVFVNERLLIYTTVSRAIWRDSTALSAWVQYIGLSEIKFSLEMAVVNGVMNGPTGIVNEPCTVTVPKGATTSNSISTINIDAQWSAMSPGSKERAVWLANDDTCQKLDQLAISGAWAETIYLPRGAYGNQRALIKGCELVPCEACPIIGTPGDLICADLGDYVFTHCPMSPNASPLSFSIEVPNDQFHRGIRGLPDGAVETRGSEHAYFSTDLLAVVFKLRGTGRFIWNTTATNINGATVGPAAIIAAR